MDQAKSAVSILSRFGRDARGATALEFGIIAVPFLGLLLAIMELGLRFLINSNLEAGVKQASRALLTGAAQTAGVSTASQFRTTYLCPAAGSSVLGSFIDCTKLIIDVRVSTAFSGSDLSNGFYKTQTTNQFCPGAPSAITVVRVAYPMPSFLPILAIGTSSSVGVNTTGLVNDVPGNPGWKHLLVGTSIFQAENYPAANYTKLPGC